MTQILQTLGRVLVGFLLACIVAGLVQVLFVETPKELAATPAGELLGKTGSTLGLTLIAATQFAVFSAAFALIAAGIAEWLSLRSPAYWLAAGTGIALLGFIAQYASEASGQPSIFNNYALQAYLTAGFFGGLVYWLVAGAYSGANREAAQAVSVATPKPRIIVEKAEQSLQTEVKKGSLAEKLALKRSKDKLEPAAAAPATGTDVPKPAASAGPTTAVPVTKAAAPTVAAAAKASAGSAEEA